MFFRLTTFRSLVQNSLIRKLSEQIGGLLIAMGDKYTSKYNESF